MELRVSFLNLKNVIIFIIIWMVLAGMFLNIPSRKTVSRLVQKAKKCYNDFQTIENGTAFVYSAYIDDRPARDANLTAEDSGGAVVRVFVYFLRTLDTPRNWKCMFWYKKQDVPKVTTIAGITDLNHYSNLRFVVAMIICNLPKNPPDYLLQGISIGKSAPTGVDVRNFVCLRDLRQMPSKSDGQSSSAEVTPNAEDCVSGRCSNKTVNFTVCLKPIHGSFYDLNDVVNFIEVNRLFGAEKFIFYVDANLDPSMRYCLESYSQQGIVEMYPFTPPALDGLIYHGQIITISECIYRTMHRTKYLISKDMDEVIVPLKTDGWQAMIDSINSRHSNPDLIASYNFRNQFFPMQAPDDKQFHENVLVKRYNIKTLLKTGKIKYIHPHDDRSKVLARPDRLLIWHTHFIEKVNLVRKQDMNCHVSVNDGLMYHYRTIDAYKNDTVREIRMHRWTDAIINRIHSGIGICRPID